MPDTFKITSQHWRQRAKEARLQAEQLADPEAKRAMLAVAEAYDKLAVAAERKMAGKPH